MSDATSGGHVPPKRRFGFKKAAWQTAAPKKEEEDMFSHSNDFKDIVAEEAKRKAEERRKVEDAKKKKEEDARKQRQEEERNQNKRKVSMEMDEDIKRSGSGDSRRSSNKGRSKTPLSPTRENPADSLARRYDLLTKSSNVNAAQADVIDLGDSDDDYPPVTHFRDSPIPVKHTMPMRSVKRAGSSDIEEGEDPALVELRARARAREAARAAKAAVASTTASREGIPRAPVQLLMMSEIPDTIPLMVKVRLDTTLEKPREAWCKRQGFTPQQSQEIFLTFKMTRIYNSTKVERLGLQDLGNGCVKMEGDEAVYDEDDLAKPVVQMWTEALFQQHLKQEAEDAAAEKKAAPTYEEPTPEPELEPKKNIRLILRAKHQKDWKVVVRPDTEISKLMGTYKIACGLPTEQPITLVFDDERLKPMDVVSDYDIEDGDSIEVYLK